MQPIVLASTSPYRKLLLQRLGLPFETAAPDVEEQPQPGESAEALVTRLSVAKARAVAQRYPDALIIGSDQAAVLGTQILGKPGDHARAAAQLQAASGKAVTFLTGLCVLNSASGRQTVAVIPYTVFFRPLSDAQIEHYLRHERPYDCAGSFKSEGLGISLFERMAGDDPTSLIGLPLIELTSMLASHGRAVLDTP